MSQLIYCRKRVLEKKMSGWCLGFQYDEKLVALLKKEIPASSREYNPATHEWWISEQYEDLLDQWFANWYQLARPQGTARHLEQVVQAKLI